jgi:hypothetical protein
MIAMLGSIAYTFYLFNRLNQTQRELQNSKAALTQKDVVHSKLIDSLITLIKNPADINQEEIEKIESKTNNADYYIGVSGYSNQAELDKYLKYFESKGYTIYYSKLASPKKGESSKIIYYGDSSKDLAIRLAAEFEGRLKKKFNVVPGRGKNIPAENRDKYLIIHVH